jgi:two-component system C4-dicarboxylate transport response regulator DctD
VAVPGAGFSKALRLLVVEDEEELLDIFSRRLARAGYAVTPVPTAEEAIEKLNELVFDAVVSDIQLPGKSGFDVFEHARALNSPLRFFFVTGHGEGTPEMTRALAAGADGVFSKPLFMSELLKRLADLALALG